MRNSRRRNASASCFASLYSFIEKVVLTIKLDHSTQTCGSINMWFVLTNPIASVHSNTSTLKNNSTGTKSYRRVRLMHGIRTVTQHLGEATA